MSNLYELSSELARINNDIIDAEGEISEELETLLDSVELSFNDKLAGCGKWVLNLRENEKGIDAEIKRLIARKRLLRDQRERFLEYIKACMESVKCKKMEFDIFTLTICKNPPSVEIIDSFDIPVEFFVTVPETSRVDKKAIGESLKKGEAVPGARLITGKTSLRVR